MSFICVQSQPPESSGNGKTTLEKGGRDPPNVSLNDIVCDLLSYFNEIDRLRVAEKEAEKKYDIVKEHGDCWPADDIKRAWGKTQRMEKESPRRRHWTLVIMLKIIERQRKGLFDMTEGGHLVQRCGELSVNNMPDRMKADRENRRREDDRRSTVDMSQACGNSTFNETDDMSENPSEEKLQKGDGTGEIGSEKSNSQTVYIKIPLSAMSDSELKDAGQNVSSPYKFIDGYPSDRPTDIRGKKSYVTSYNKETKNAEWVYEILNRSTLADNHIDLSFGTFMKNKNFQQGHLAAAGNHTWCQEAYNSTFLFSNISPQVELLNKGIWKVLENACRNKIKNDKEHKILNVHVYTGPVLTEDGSESSGDEWSWRKITSMRNPKKKKTSDGGSENVKEVPTQFFKVIIAENYNGTVEEPVCYLIPNDKDYLTEDETVKGMVGSEMTPEKTLQTYEKPLEEIERLSGLKFTAETCKKGETDGIKKVKWEGEGGNGEKCTAEIKVRISKPHP